MAPKLGNGSDLGVNLVGGIRPPLIPAKRDTFGIKEQPFAVEELTPGQVHLALVKIRDPGSIDDQTLYGVGRSLVQLSMLGMGCCVVIEPGGDCDETWRREASKQADRMVAAINANGGPGAICVNYALNVDEQTNAISVLARKLLLTPLQQGRILVIPPVGYTLTTPRAVPVAADNVVLALTREFGGLAIRTDPDEDALTSARRARELQEEVSVDRLIVLDPVGGIPDVGHGPRTAHIFINLEQEHEDIVSDLGEAIRKAPLKQPGQSYPVSSLGQSNPISRFVEQEVVSLPKMVRDQGQGKGLPQVRNQSQQMLEQHLRNLYLLSDTLTYLPRMSSGIITTPADADATRVSDALHPGGVGTRPKRNPLIHNILTDKPLQSPSLPMGRLGVSPAAAAYTHAHANASPDLKPSVHSTFVKKGLPLTVFPDPRTTDWAAEARSGCMRMHLNDPRIDLGRLAALIEDSFGRPLDLPKYVSRIGDRLAGVIVAGEYDGGAVLTWELPPGVADDGSPESRARMVPYLDKFAVRKRSQGAGGVADVVFNAMVRSCLPGGVCWRSRRTNVVNKWYFERALGTWKLPGSGWTMFWTTPRLLEAEEGKVFADYEAVCRGVKPTWE